MSTAIGSVVRFSPPIATMEVMLMAPSGSPSVNDATTRPWMVGDLRRSLMIRIQELENSNVSMRPNNTDEVLLVLLVDILMVDRCWS